MNQKFNARFEKIISFVSLLHNVPIYRWSSKGVFNSGFRNKILQSLLISPLRAAYHDLERRNTDIIRSYDFYLNMFSVI